MGEIEKLMGEIGTSNSFRVVNLGGKSVYIEGIKSVISFDNKEMRFQLKNNIISVKGCELKVKYLDSSTCVITGEIKVVESI